MPEDLRQVEQVAAVPQVGHGESVPEGMPRAADAGKRQVFADCRQISLKVSYAAHGVVAGAEHEPPLVFFYVEIQDFTALEGQRYFSLFLSLSHHRDEQVVKVDVGRYERSGLINP